MQNAFVFLGNEIGNISAAVIKQCRFYVESSPDYRFATFCNRGSSFSPAVRGCLSVLPEFSTVHLGFIAAPDGRQVIGRTHLFPDVPSSFGRIRRGLMDRRAKIFPSVWLPPHDHGRDRLIGALDIGHFLLDLGVQPRFRVNLAPGLTDNAMFHINNFLATNDVPITLVTSPAAWFPDFIGEMPKSAERSHRISTALRSVT
ncbi:MULTISPECIES: hypothetical protein [unclassified Chelatococcus]|uniref:hypothetical protein n=1 Tax=unclassified Chelatococcus TaxID=2638111 RepID=UPI001BCCCA3B|nr:MULTISPECIES: hypothetical protein [unclassified Chelatococcus]MBS7696908.1 hypothetical protein [Chelatococcus sp. YT9]MBX3555898.1 hypothetical protein [Chelatococcus sp.]